MLFHGFGVLACIRSLWAQRPPIVKHLLSHFSMRLRTQSLLHTFEYVDHDQNLVGHCQNISVMVVVVVMFTPNW